jgi:2-dehydropantoate 2-reductase
VSPSQRKPYIALAGPGAVGGLLAASLRRSGNKVLLIGNGPAHVRELSRKGIVATDLRGKSRTYRGWLKISARTRSRQGCEAVIITVKAPALPAALRAVRPLVGPETAVVFLLNGVGHIDAAYRTFGAARTVLGACYIAAMRTGRTSVVHTGGGGIALGRTKENLKAVDKALRLLRGAGWTTRATDAPKRLLWTKTIYNAAVNPIGTLTRKTNGELASIPALRDLVSGTVREATEVAKRAGFPPIDRNPVAAVLRGCKAAPKQFNSMAQDVAAGRKTEIDSILKPLIAEAKKQKRKTRYLEPLYQMMRRLERR